MGMAITSDDVSSFGRSPADSALRGLFLLERTTKRYNRLPVRVRAASVFLFLATAFGALLGFPVIFSEHVSVMLMAIVVATVAIALSWWLLAWILRHDAGNDQMRAVAEPIREGSEGFLAVQYGTILHLAALVGTGLFTAFFFSGSETSGVGRLGGALLPALTFCAGAVCSAAAGYSGMWVSVRTNVRVASAASRCYNQALQLCFR